MSEPWLSADDIASHLGVTTDTVYSWIASRAMPAHKIGRLWKFQTSEVDAWVRAAGRQTTTSGGRLTRPGRSPGRTRCRPPAVP